MRFSKLFIFFFIFSFPGLFAQPGIDSLQAVLAKAAADTTRIHILSEMAGIYFKDNNFEKTRECAVKIVELSGKTASIKGQARAYEIFGLLDDSKSDFEAALENYNHSILLYEKEGDAYHIAILHQDIANAYYSLGTNDKALKHYIESLKLREQMGDSSAMASSYMGMSNVYGQMNRHDLALDFAKKALRLKQKYNEQRMVSWLLNNVGAIYLESGDTASALPYYFRSVELKKQLNDQYGLATTYKNIGTIHLRKKQYGTALDYYRRALDIRMKLNPDDAYEMAVCFDDIGSVYMDMSVNDSAVYYFGKAIELGEKVNSYELLRLPYSNMAQVLAKKGDYEEAYRYELKYRAAKDSTLSSETNALMTEMAAKYDNEKKEQRIALQELEISDQKKTNILVIAIAAFAVLLAFVMLRGYLSKKKANQLLQEKNALIEHQKALVEEKNKDITDSIHYAQRIQRAILPSAEYQQKLIPDSFTLFKPKDIVSGDFYWMEQWKDKIIIAVVDCTGHGVPGAFMTFVSYSLLNEAVLEHGISDPAAILDEMRKNLNRMLRQKNDAEALKDGMDISICVFDRNAMTLEYAGAYNPLWLVRNEKLVETKADKQPIGVFTGEEEKPFTGHRISLEKGDMIYLFTDGYADQFGGDKGKKFKYKSLQELLIAIHHKPAGDQKADLERSFENWKGRLEQLDDVCIFGMRI
ncbi:MAG: yrrB 5 [Bacteroidetes bacterium]|nr:yrrB 5 [Bacteroidota bacterium]